MASSRQFVLLLVGIVILTNSCQNPPRYESALRRNEKTRLVVSTLIGKPEAFGQEDGAGSRVRLHNPASLLTDVDGSVIVSDLGNHSLRRVDNTGKVTTIANPSAEPGIRDGAFLYGQLRKPWGLTLALDRSIFVSDPDTHRIRRLLTNGRLDTFAGSGEAGFANGPLLIARFNAPHGLTFDGEGNLIIADTGNHCIRVLTPDRITNTVAGSPAPGFRDGLGHNALFHLPTAIATSPSSPNTVFVADTGNHAIRKVDENGLVTTIAGVGSPGHQDGPSDLSLFRSPQGIVVDRESTVFVADTQNHCIRRISADGIVTTVAGSPGVPGYADGTGSQARFRDPMGLVLTQEGILLVADKGNHVVRSIVPAE